MNRITDTAKRYQARIQGHQDNGVDKGGRPIDASLELLDSEMALTFQEHFLYQELQARAHAAGTISRDEAQTIYLALGEVRSERNGGWQPHVDLALKTTITQIVGELIGIDHRRTA